MRVGRGKEECVVVATSAATHHARHFFPTNRIHECINICLSPFLFNAVIRASCLFVSPRGAVLSHKQIFYVPAQGSGV
jgi:hypothetical protein